MGLVRNTGQLVFLRVGLVWLLRVFTLGCLAEAEFLVEVFLTVDRFAMMVKENYVRK